MPTDWLTLPELAEELDETLGRVKRLLDESHLVASRRHGAPRVPSLFVLDGRPLSSLRGTVIVLHDVNMAARYCDHLVALHSGQVLAQGAPRELMCDSTLEAIYGIPMRVMSHPGGEHPIAVLH